MAICPKCERFIKGNYCGKCKIKIEEIKLPAIVEQINCACGRRGKLINGTADSKKPNYLCSGESSKTLCYWCYHDLDKRKGFYQSKEKNQTAVEKNYYKALEKYYLVPLFYGDEPDLRKLQIANDMKLGINKHLWHELNETTEIPIEFKTADQ